MKKRLDILVYENGFTDSREKAKAVIIALHDIESIIILSHTIKDLNENVKILAKVTKKSILPDNIDSEDFIDIYDCTAELLVEKIGGKN